MHKGKFVTITVFYIYVYLPNCDVQLRYETNGCDNIYNKNIFLITNKMNNFIEHRNTSNKIHPWLIE